jgi:SAM-dependent methyltransferase
MSVAQSLFARGLRLIDSAQHRIYADRKTRLLGGLRGTVVEIGPGTGLNLAYLNRSVTYVGLEPNRHLHERIRAQMRTHGIQGHVLGDAVEAEVLPAQSADAVISTLVLCSVPDVDMALASIQRLLRPGRPFVFIEHIAAAQHSWPRMLQEGITPLWHRCFDGCHPNRATDNAIRQAGFNEVSMSYFSVGVPVIHPHCAGYAVA